MSLIKLEALERFIQGDEELLADLSTLFVQYYPDIEARLNLAIDNGDGESLRETAHQLKSRLGYFQAPVLVDCACRLETCGKTGDLDDADAILKTLFDGIRQLKTLLAPFEIEIVVVDLPHYKGPSDVFHLIPFFIITVR